MLANNEIGTLQPARGDRPAVQGARRPAAHRRGAGGRQNPARRRGLQVDLLSLSAHKMYGPKGVGALYVRRRNPPVRLEPLFDGGGHERGLRSGTLPVPLIVGLGVACELCREEMPAEAERMRGLRDRLYAGLTEPLEDVSLNGHPDGGLPGNLNVSFAHVHGEALLMAPAEPGRQLRLGLHVGQRRAQLRAAALGIGDDLAHAQPPLRPGPLQHRGGDRLRHRRGGPRGRASASISPLRTRA